VVEMEVSGKRTVGRPMKTWKDIVRDLELLVVDENVALDRRRCTVIKRSFAYFTENYPRINLDM